MKIIFFGSGKIAVTTLESLCAQRYQLEAVVTTPDKKQGRHLILTPTPVKEFALKHKLTVLEPTDLSCPQTIESIKKMNADIFIVFSYGKLLPQPLLDSAQIMPLNIHTSLLPKYRGAAPINWALIHGETKTGVSIIRMNKKMDAGDIVLQKEIPIQDNDNALTLSEKLETLAVRAIEKTIKLIEKGKIDPKPQAHQRATFAPKLKKHDGKIVWNTAATTIRNAIRGCYQWPGAYAFLHRKIVKLWDASIIEEQSLVKDKKIVPGAIVSIEKKGIVVCTKKDFLLIKELQPESGKRLSAWQFAQGHTLKVGEVFT